MQIEIDFNFVNFNDDLDNDTVYNIRRSIAEMFRDSGFGDVIEGGDGRMYFTNEQAAPFTVSFIGEGQHELFVGYFLNITNDTSAHLSALLVNGAPQLYNRITENYPNVHTYIRTTYSPE